MTISWQTFKTWSLAKNKLDKEARAQKYSSRVQRGVDQIESHETQSYLTNPLRNDANGMITSKPRSLQLKSRAAASKIKTGSEGRFCSILCGSALKRSKMLLGAAAKSIFQSWSSKSDIFKISSCVSGRQLTNGILLILSHNKVHQKSGSGTCVKLLKATEMIFKSQLELLNFQLSGRANQSSICSSSLLLFEPKRWSCQSLLYESLHFARQRAKTLQNASWGGRKINVWISIFKISHFQNLILWSLDHSWLMKYCSYSATTKFKKNLIREHVWSYPAHEKRRFGR